MAQGTFTGTGQSPVFAATKFSIKLKFAGAASIDAEVRMENGSWIKLPSANGVTLPATADCVIEYSSIALTALRLNCTAYTNDVAWNVETL